MADIEGQKASIGGKVDPDRVIARVKRLRKALERATGDKKVELEKALEEQQAHLDRIKAALDNV